MKLLSSAFLLATTFAIVAAAPAHAADADKSPANALFVSKCAPCHGKAGTPPAAYAKIGVRRLSDPEWQKSKTDAEIQEVVVKGSKGTAMRAFKELKPADVDALVKFVRTLNGAPAK